MTLRIIQPALPAYRVAFFNRLSAAFDGGLVVYGSPSPGLVQLDVSGSGHPWFRDLGREVMIAPGVRWQFGAARVPIQPDDVLVVPGAPRTLSNLTRLAAARRRGAKTIWWGHYRSSTSREWRIRLRHQMMRWADGVALYTDREVDEFRGRCPWASKVPVVGLNNGIETDAVTQVRDEYRLEFRDRDVLFLGRLTEKAEVELLLKALARDECSGLSLDVIGDGAIRGKLEKQARSAGIAERVRWHGGLLDERAIAAVTNRCKLLAYPGAVGLSLIHAFAYGLPCIVHDQERTQGPEFAAHRDGENGRTFRRGDVASLAEVLATTMGDPNCLERMSSGALATVQETFNCRDMADRFVRLVREVESG